MKTVLIDDRPTDFEGAVILMDDDIRERLHSEMVPCSEQEFVDAYCKAHEEKFGEQFTAG